MPGGGLQIVGAESAKRGADFLAFLALGEFQSTITTASLPPAPAHGLSQLRSLPVRSCRRASGPASLVTAVRIACLASLRRSQWDCFPLHPILARQLQSFAGNNLAALRSHGNAP